MPILKFQRFIEFKNWHYQFSTLSTSLSTKIYDLLTKNINYQQKYLLLSGGNNLIIVYLINMYMYYIIVNKWRLLWKKHVLTISLLVIIFIIGNIVYISKFRGLNILDR